MSVKLHQTRIQAGIWEAVVTGAAQRPDIKVIFQGQEQSGLEVTAVPARPEDYALRFTIPASALSEGVQTFLLRHEEETLGQFSVVTGLPFESDLRAEIDLLRAELEVVKAALRAQFRK